MATTTTNLGLTKPIGTEQALVSVINGNMDIIDTKVGAVPANKNVQGEIDSLSDQIKDFVRIEALYQNTTLANVKASLDSAYGTKWIAFINMQSPTDGNPSGFYIGMRNSSQSSDVRWIFTNQGYHVVGFGQQDITSNVTWASNLTFPSLKSAIKLLNGYIQVSVTISSTNFTNGMTVATIPYTATNSVVAVGFVDNGNSVPVGDNVCYASITSGSKDIKVYKTTPSSGFATFTICIPIY